MYVLFETRYETPCTELNYCTSNYLKKILSLFKLVRKDVSFQLRKTFKILQNLEHIQFQNIRLKTSCNFKFVDKKKEVYLFITEKFKYS